MSNYQENKGVLWVYLKDFLLLIFLILVKSFQNLCMHIEEKSIPTCWACPHARDHVQTFYFISVESC